MLRWLFLVIALLPLAGCESDEDFWQPYNDAVGGLFGDATPATATAPLPEDDHCRQVAYARAADARANGFDDDMRDEIYAGTYQNCVSWARAHLDIRS